MLTKPQRPEVLCFPLLTSSGGLGTSVSWGTLFLGYLRTSQVHTCIGNFRGIGFQILRFHNYAFQNSLDSSLT